MNELKTMPEKIVNLLSAVLVLIAGIYVIFFMPAALSLAPAMRLTLGIILILYFLIRIWYFVKKSTEKKPFGDDIELESHNKGLDKRVN
jgi:hypothetical protein